MSKLRSDCEKEMEEIVAQLRLKYEAKIKDAEVEFRSKRDEAEKNRNIVFMNKILAKAFRSKCVDLKVSLCPGMQQAFQLGFMPLPSTRLPSAASASQSLHQQTVAPFLQDTLSRQPIPNSMLPLSQSKCNGSTTRTSCTTYMASNLWLSSRPPVISGITSATNPHVGRVIYSPAPHLQSFAPTVPSLGGQIRSSASHLHPFRYAASPYVGGETHSQSSHLQPFRPAVPTSTDLHQDLPKQKYRCLNQLP